MKKPYVKPELTVIKPGSPKYNKLMEQIKPQQNNSGPRMHSAAPNGSWCGDQRQLSAANGTLN